MELRSGSEILKRKNSSHNIAFMILKLNMLYPNALQLDIPNVAGTYVNFI